MTTSSREEEIRQDIERTRKQLGDTVEALAHKVAVPARVEETVQVKAEEVKQQAQAKAEEVTEQVLEAPKHSKPRQPRWRSTPST
jgi:TolA-binding protein